MTTVKNTLACITHIFNYTRWSTSILFTWISAVNGTKLVQHKAWKLIASGKLTLKKGLKSTPGARNPEPEARNPKGEVTWDSPEYTGFIIRTFLVPSGNWNPNPESLAVFLVSGVNVQKPVTVDPHTP